jgi:zinc protease
MSSAPPLATRVTVATLCLLAALTAGASGAAPEPPPPLTLAAQTYTLPNGLRVILRRDSRLPLVAVRLCYHVGPAREGPGRTGFAHLFEHLMFQGSGHVGPDMHFRHLEGAGASNVNGYTNFDRTCYVEDLPSNQLELALWLESDRMGFLLDRLDQGMLSNQQDVVRSERRQSYENAPYGLAKEAVYQTLFPAGHPYHAAIIGSHADIQAARLEDARDFFARYYAPNDATLVIVGDIDSGRTQTLVEKYFGTLPRGPAVPPLDVVTPPVTAERRVALTDQVELPRVYLTWLTAPYFAPGDAEADLAARILGGGEASRLYRSLVYTQRIAQDVGAWQGSSGLASVFQIRATARPGHTAEELEAAIDRELAALVAAGPTAEELESARTALETTIVTGLETVGGVADRIQEYQHYVGDPDYLARDLERYRAVTPAAIQAFAGEQLAKDRRAVILVAPGEKVLPPAPPTPPTPEVAPAPPSPAVSKEPWRDEVPRPAPTTPAPLPAAKRFELENGLAVYLVEDHTWPVVAAQLNVRAGSAADDPSRPGLAGFATALLDQGTARHDTAGLARAFEALGTQLETWVLRDGSVLSVRTLSRNAEPALGLLAEVALTPTFPADEVERVRGRRLTALQQDRDSPARIAYTVGWTDLYGPQHPYGHMTIGTEPGLTAITREDLVRFHRSAYTPGNAALVLAGDLTEADARRLAESLFGAWSGGERAERVTVPPTPAADRVLVVDRPGAPQTQLVLAQIGAARSDPDYEAFLVMNQILGGLFSSRLNLNLREAHGWTYGASSSPYPTTAPGPLWLASEVRADATGPAIREMLAEVRAMLAAPVRPDELALAKESIARTLPATFAGTARAANAIGDLFLLDLPPDYYEALPARIDALTAERVLAATRALLKPDDLKVIAVGDRAVIDPQLAALGLGPVAYRLPDGRPAPAPAASAGTPPPP